MELKIINPIVFAAPCFIGFILMELLYWRKHGPNNLYKVKDLKSSTLIGLGTAILAPFAKITFVTGSFILVYEFFNPVIDGVRMNIMGYRSFGFEWYYWIICQFLDDFTFYWYHRLSHTIRILWAAHITHHSSEYYNFGTGIRIGWFVLLYKHFFYFWILAIGFPVEIVIVCLGIESIYQFQLHTRFVPKLGLLEKVFVTPTQHQVHHGRNIEYLDKNHGGILCVFDRLFGTYKEFNDGISIEYGVLNKPSSYNPLHILIHEFKDIWSDVKKSKDLKTVFKFIFGPPGWSPDGSRKTARQLQEVLELRKNHVI